jgi:hypothetical protein
MHHFYVLESQLIHKSFYLLYWGSSGGLRPNTLRARVEEGTCISRVASQNKEAEACAFGLAMIDSCLTQYTYQIVFELQLSHKIVDVLSWASSEALRPNPLRARVEDGTALKATQGQMHDFFSLIQMPPQRGCICGRLI